MTNTITLHEPEVNNLLGTYTGLQLERAPAQNGTWAVLVQIPYVTDQQTYTYLDTTGTMRSWYRSVRYGPSGLFGTYSNEWPVTEAAIAGITLAQLEQEVARRTGPFFQAAQDAGTSSTTIAAIMPTLKTNAVLGGPENLWLVRRGVLADGSPSPQPVIAADRIRMVQAFDSAAGRVIVDRNWRDPMQPDELADFTHLHPSQELRVAVLAGLRRCFIEDRGRVYPNQSGGQTDLTSFLPWLNSPRQVLRVQTGYAVAGTDVPFEAVTQAGHVVLATGASSSGSWLTAMRPAWSWVNGAESKAGPTDDYDTIPIDLDYAASAGHIEAWHLFPSRMFAAAAGNLQASQEMAAREFTRQAMIWGPQSTGSIGFSETVRLPL